MAEPYEFLRPKDFSLFDENDGLRGAIDLMGFSFDEESSYGMLERVIKQSRKVLSGATPDAARAILWLGDMLLDQTLDDISVVVNGRKVGRSEIDFKGVNQLDFIQLVLATLSRVPVAMGDEELGVDDIEVTPARFCAAYALRMAYNASRDYLTKSDGSDLRDYYLMQASAAYGLMLSFGNDEQASISGAVSLAIRSQGAKEAAAARWRADPKAAAMRDIREEWERMRRGERPHLSDAAFAREMHRVHASVIASDGSIKNAISRWRKE